MEPLQSPAPRRIAVQVAACLASVMLALPLPASALCVGCACTVSTTAVAFGAYAPLSGAPGSAVGNVSMRCTTTLGLALTYSIKLGKGNNSASFTPRQMASGSKRLDYNLYTSAAYTSIWGDNTSGTSQITGNITLNLLTATTRNHTVYGRIPASQNLAPPGAYNDAVVVTVTYD